MTATPPRSSDLVGTVGLSYSHTVALVFFVAAVLLSIFTLLIVPSSLMSLTYFIFAVSCASVRENTSA